MTAKRRGSFDEGLNPLGGGAHRLPGLIKRLMQPLGLRLGTFRHHNPIEPRLPSQPTRALAHGPRVSIVTPSYNQVRFLEATILSVLNQCYPNIEYIVQDGGSTDGSVDTLHGYADRLRYWASEPDRGQAHAINLGFRHATGEIMAWLNSDDLLLPGAVDAVVRYFQSHPEVDVVYGHRVVVDEEGREVGRWILPGHSGAALLWRDFIPQETLFWRRRLWERVGSAVDESYSFAIDWDLVVRFHRAGARFARVPRFLGAFRTHEQQKSLAWVEDTGRVEFDRIRRRHIGRPLPSLVARLRSAAYLLRSIAYTWGYELGLLRME
jgi:glycosyltransferase involved in cell wall biosynthesis